VSRIHIVVGTVAYKRRSVDLLRSRKALGEVPGIGIYNVEAAIKASGENHHGSLEVGAVEDISGDDETRILGH